MNTEEHPTSNFEHQLAARILAHFGVRRSTFDVRRSMFSLVAGDSPGEFSCREILPRPTGYPARRRNKDGVSGPLVINPLFTGGREQLAVDCPAGTGKVDASSLPD